MSDLVQKDREVREQLEHDAQEYQRLRGKAVRGQLSPDEQREFARLSDIAVKLARQGRRFE